MATFSLKTKKYIMENAADMAWNTEYETSLGEEGISSSQPDSIVTISSEKITDANIETEKISIHSNAAIIERSSIPETHRQIADNYMIIKKIFKFSVVQCMINDKEKELLKAYNLPFLNDSTAEQMNNELILLKDWGESFDRQMQELSSNILDIRVKELKYLIANYSSGNIFEGTRVLERYLENISKYRIE